MLEVKIEQIGEGQQRERTNLIAKFFYYGIPAAFAAWFLFNVFATNTDIWNQ